MILGSDCYLRLFDDTAGRAGLQVRVLQGLVEVRVRVVHSADVVLLTDATHTHLPGQPALPRQQLLLQSRR